MGKVPIKAEAKEFFNRPTRTDVAKMAGVSETTVSYVYSKKRRVSEDLADRVINAAKALNYYPDMVASSLMSKQTNTIAVLVSDLTSPLQMSIIKALQRAAIEKGYFVNACGGEKDFEAYINNFISRRVDAAYIAVKTNEIDESHIKKLLDYNIKVVINSARKIDDIRLCGIEMDLDFGIKIIIEHLRGLGHRKIVFLGCYDDAYVTDRRLPAFRKYMREFFSEGNPLVGIGEPPYESGIEDGGRLMARMLARTRDFTAVVCLNDLMALGAIRVLQANGINVPGDVSVAGIDNIEFSAFSFPALTTIDHKCYEMGETLFNMLYENIVTGRSGHRVLYPELIIRESTAYCKPEV